MNRRRAFIISLLTSSAFMLLMHWVFGIYLGTYENVFAAMAYGELGEPPFELWSLDLHFLIYPALAVIADWFPSVPVYGWWLCFLNFIWINLFVWLWQIIFHEQLKKSFLFVLLSVSLLFLFSNSVIRLHSNRISILVSGVAMLLYYHDRAASTKVKWFYFIVFLLGVLTRFQTALFAVGIVGLYILLDGNTFKTFLHRYRFHLVTLLTVGAIYFINGILEKNLGKIIETQYEFAILDQRSFHPLANMTNAVDTAKYIAITNYLITDTAQINENFLARVVEFKAHFTNPLQPEKIQPALLVVGQYIKLYWRSFSSFLFLVILALLVSRQKLLVFKKVTVLFLSFCLLIFVLSISFNMFERVFSPLRAVLIICCIIICLNEILKSTHAQLLIMAVTFFLLLMDIFKIESLKEITREVHEEELAYLESIRKFVPLVKNNKVMVLMGEGVPYTRSPFERKYHEIYSQIIQPDLGFTTYYPSIKKRMTNNYGFSPLDFKGMYQFIMKNREDLVIYAPSSRVRLFEYYYKTVYNLDITFQDMNDTTFLPMRLFKATGQPSQIDKPIPL